MLEPGPAAPSVQNGRVPRHERVVFEGAADQAAPGRAQRLLPDGGRVTTRTVVVQPSYWFVGATFDMAYACDALGCGVGWDILVTELCLMQGRLYKATGGLYGARAKGVN